jgi:hypothetical protein
MRALPRIAGTYRYQELAELASSKQRACTWVKSCTTGGSSLQKQRCPFPGAFETPHIDGNSMARTITDKYGAMRPPAASHLPANAFERVKVNVTAPRAQRQSESCGAEMQAHQDSPGAQGYRDQENPKGFYGQSKSLSEEYVEPDGSRGPRSYQLSVLSRHGDLLFLNLLVGVLGPPGEDGTQRQTARFSRRLQAFHSSSPNSGMGLALSGARVGLRVPENR